MLDSNRSSRLYFTSHPFEVYDIEGIEFSCKTQVLVRTEACS